MFSAHISGVMGVTIDLTPVFNNEDLSLPFNYEFSMSSYVPEGEDNPFSPIKAKGKVFNRTGIVYLSALSEFTYSARCDRCASDIERQMAVPSEHILLIGNEDEAEESDVEYDDRRLFIPSYQLNLDDLLAEDIWLSMPVTFLCSEDCKGICPNCGTNLNDGNCSCKKAVDPRLEALAKLLNDD